MSLTAERRAELRAEHAEVMRDAERRCRASGMYEHANAIRMLADGIVEGWGSDTVFDSGVFDKHGPVDQAGEVPYLVELSPRLRPELYRQVPWGYVLLGAAVSK